MSTDQAKMIYKLVLILFCLLVVPATQASEPKANPRFQVKDGMAIYLGLLPAEMIQGHVANKMHGGIPSGTYRYHVSIALFNDQTGERINNAKVLVRINNRIGVGPDAFKELEGMEMNGQFMHGNYFILKTAGPYRVDVKVLRGDNKPVQVTFNYDFAHT